MKKTGPKNRGSHPNGLPLTGSGLYISCAYLLGAFRNSVARSRCFPAVRKQIIHREHLAERDFLTRLHQTLNAPSHPIRNRLLRLTADSPDLLAIIKQEGKV